MGLFNRESKATTAARSARIDARLAEQRAERERLAAVAAEKARKAAEQKRIAEQKRAEQKRRAELAAARALVEKDRARKVEAAKKLLRDEARRKRDTSRDTAGAGAKRGER